MQRHDGRWGAWAAICITLILLLAMPGFAQNRIIKGKVTDEQDQPIKDAQILIMGTDVKREYKVKSDKKGEYFYMGIPFGVYRIVVRAQGFQPDYAEGIRPSIAQETETNFKLKQGSDRKLAFELSPEEMEKLKQESQAAEKQKQASSEVKGLFEGGIALAQAGKYAEAVVEYKKALEKDAEQPYIIANMADALGRMGKNDEAIEAYQKAIALKPDDAAMYTNLGVVYGRMGKTAESQGAFKKAAAMNPGAAAQNFYNLGATLVNSGKPMDAAEAFKQSIAADPNFAEAYYQLGICLSGSPASIPEAVKALQKYAEIGKNAEQVEVAKQLVIALQPPKDTKKKP